MNPRDRDLNLYLEDILISIERIQEYVKDLDFELFILDSKTTDAVIRNFEIIGEAAKNLPVPFKTKYNEVPWDEMYRLRNRVSHEYFGIDHEIIWHIITEYLPKNYIDIKLIINLEEPGG